jgi:hypothetical protein
LNRLVAPQINKNFTPCLLLLSCNLLLKPYPENQDFLPEGRSEHYVFTGDCKIIKNAEYKGIIILISRAIVLLR